MRKITQTIVGTTPPLDKNVIWLDSTDNTAPVEKVFINDQWTPMGIDTDDYYTKEEVNDKLDEKLDVIETPVNGNLIAMDSQGQAIDSGKKTTDFIATPTDSGSEGEVLSVDSEGNPVWTTVTPTGTADTGMSDTSTNAVQNKVIKSYVDDNCARKDGYYSTLTAGAAENLVGQTVDSNAYLIRPTGGTENDVANGIASVLGMEGNSCVWNQNIPTIQSNWDKNLLTLSTNSMSFTWGKTTRYSSDLWCSLPTPYQLLSTHKYYTAAYINIENNTGNVLFGAAFGGSIIADGRSQTNRQKTSGRVTCISTPALNNSDSKIYINFYNADANSVTSGTKVTISNVMIIDLTLLGIDNLTTVAEVEAWLAQHVGTKPYYAYNAGEILSAQTLGIKTYGQNLLNPTTRHAKLIPYTWVENGITYSNQYTIKNVPSGATATFTPDATGVAVTVDISGGSLDITSYGSGILELSAAAANTYVCMKWNEQKDDDIVPYEDHTQEFDVRKVYGKVSGAGEYVQCYPNGMKSAGNVHDTLNGNGAVKSTYLVDLSQITSEVRFTGTNNKTIAFSVPQYFRKNNVSVLSSNYKYVGGTGGAPTVPDSMDVGLYTYNVGTGSSTQFYAVIPINSNLSGIIIYNISTPITYTDLIYRDGGIDRPLADVLMNITVNNWSMEEQLMTPYDNGNPTSIPATIKTQYGMDAVEAIDTLQKTSYFEEDVKANLQALLTCVNTNCSETLGGTFGISDTATDKVFEFTFTPNEEPEP